MFVRWSADLEHPWDAASSQNVPAAVLEVGSARTVLLRGVCCTGAQGGQEQSPRTSQAAHLISDAVSASASWTQAAHALAPKQPLRAL